MPDLLEPPSKDFLPLFFWEKVVPKVGVLKQKFRDDLELSDSNEIRVNCPNSCWHFRVDANQMEVYL